MPSSIEIDTLEKIKSKGFWKIIIRPSIFVKEKIPDLKSCKEIIRDNRVRLRGWDYPHYDQRTDPIIGEDYVGQPFCWLDRGHIEAWRYYKSGQFVHYLAVWEDWETSLQKRSYSFIDFLSTIYLFTEIYEFASRLGEKGLLGDSCEITITLDDTENRELISIDGRRPFMEEYKATVKGISYSISPTVSDIMANSDDHALNAAKYVYEKFGWLDFDRDLFKPDQKKLHNKKW
jgi:hypothetical protein